MLVSRSRRAGTVSGSSAAQARGAHGSGRPRAWWGTLRCRACGQPPWPQPGSHGGAGPAALLGLGSLLPRPCEGRLLLCACCWSRAGVRGPAAGRQCFAGAVLSLGTRRSSCPGVWIGSSIRSGRVMAGQGAAVQSHRILGRRCFAQQGAVRGWKEGRGRTGACG